MASERIRVGILGASPERGWAVTAHVPALRALPQYEITAVGTSRAESAREAARRFGAAYAFTDPRRLAEHPEVDVVAITVKVPAHAELVQAALAAGKHVYCEWPLARTTEEAESLVASARAAGVRHTIGLQARHAPAIGHARELIADGYVGRVTSATVHAARGKGAGGVMPAWAAYTVDQANGAGLLEVVGGHTLDVLEHLLGDIADLSATLSLQRPSYSIAETGETVEATSPDHLLLNATLADGSVASVHLHDAKMGETRTRLEIAGSEGDLAIVCTGVRHPQAAQIQIGELRLRGTREPGGSWQDLPVPDRHWKVPRDVPPIGVLNVAQVYAQFADDLRTGAHGTADFETGLRLHRLLDTIRLSARTGTRRSVLG
jgi:predicted dehydrogenase